MAFPFRRISKGDEKALPRTLAIGDNPIRMSDNRLIAVRLDGDEGAELIFRFLSKNFLVSRRLKFFRRYIDISFYEAVRNSSYHCYPGHVEKFQNIHSEILNCVQNDNFFGLLDSLVSKNE
jgi:hypothetical protein